MTLDDLILEGKTSRHGLNRYVTFPGFKSLYVRYTSRYIDGQFVSPVLDLANAEASKPGNGAFTALIKHLRTNYPELWLYAESVLSERVAKKLERMGFIPLQNTNHMGWPSCLYMPSVQVRMMNEQ